MKDNDPKPPVIKFAGQDAVQDLAPEVHIILAALDHPEAFVTDLSAISDFTNAFMDEALETARRRLGRLSEKFGFEVQNSDLLVDIARKMRETRESRRCRD